MAAVIPRGIRIKGYNAPKFMVPKKGKLITCVPAFITTRGIEAIKTKNNLNFTDNPPCCHPNKSSIKPTIAKIRITLNNPKISKSTLSHLIIKVLIIK